MSSLAHQEGRFPNRPAREYKTVGGLEAAPP
jgi:hypothetical protein